MIAKLVTHGPTRDIALARLAQEDRVPLTLEMRGIRVFPGGVLPLAFVEIAAPGLGQIPQLTDQGNFRRFVHCLPPVSAARAHAAFVRRLSCSQMP